MGLETVIDDKIAQGGQGSYGPGGSFPSLQVTRTTPNSPSVGIYPPGAKSYFTVNASIRPQSGSDLNNEPDSMYTLERRTLYTNTAELWPVIGAGALGAAHDADLVTLEPIAASVDLADFLADVDAVIASVIVGADSNAVTLQLLADGSGAGVLDETAWPALKFHYAPAVTTDANLVAAIAAGTKLAVIDAGTGANTFVMGDARTLSLTGGGGETWRVQDCRRYRRFWKATIERMDKP